MFKKITRAHLRTKPLLESTRFENGLPTRKRSHHSAKLRHQNKVFNLEHQAMEETPGKIHLLPSAAFFSLLAAAQRMLTELQHCPLHIPTALLSWAEARAKIARMSSFPPANSAPKLRVTGSPIALSAKMFLEHCLTHLPPKTLAFFFALAFNDLPQPYSNHPLLSVAVGAWSSSKIVKVIGALWRERCDEIDAQDTLSLAIHLCFCLLTWPSASNLHGPHLSYYIPVVTFCFLQLQSKTYQL